MSGYGAKSDVLNVIRILQSKMDDSGARALENVIGAVEDMIDADVVPVKHGHWITDEDGDSCCSVCGDQLSGELNPFKYCPFCGALMDEVTES